MKINVNNDKKIQAEIEKIEGQSSARTLNEIDVEFAVTEANFKLDELSIPLNARKGCKVFIDPGKVAGVYKYRAEGTFIILERGSKNWFMISAKRSQVGSCRDGRNGKSRLFLSDFAISAMKTSFDL